MSDSSSEDLPPECFHIVEIEESELIIEEDSEEGSEEDDEKILSLLSEQSGSWDKCCSNFFVKKERSSASSCSGPENILVTVGNCFVSFATVCDSMNQENPTTLYAGCSNGFSVLFRLVCFPLILLIELFRFLLYLFCSSDDVIRQPIPFDEDYTKGSGFQSFSHI